MDLPRFDHPWVNETYAPIFVTAAPELPTREDFDAYLARLDAWSHEARAPYVFVIKVARLSALQRKNLAESQKRREAVMKKYQVGVAFVVNSPVVRAGLNAVFLFAPPPVTHVVFSEESEALLWAQRVLRARQHAESERTAG